MMKKLFGRTRRQEISLLLFFAIVFFSPQLKFHVFRIKLSFDIWFDVSFKRSSDIKFYCLNKHFMYEIFGNGIDDNDKPFYLFGESVWVTRINLN